MAKKERKGSSKKDQGVRAIPAVGKVLNWPAVGGLVEIHPRRLVVRAVHEVLAEEREAILGGRKPSFGARKEWMAGIVDRLTCLETPSLRRVVNATGIVVHTNLGRSPLSPGALAAIADNAGSYCSLEMDLEKGERSSRALHIRDTLCELTGAESSLIVNNNAAAVMLALHTLASGSEVIVSRGELVEIGGSFRIPDIMATSGAVLREVGTTNKTRIADYRAVVNESTALLLKVHTSNFRIMGFTESVERSDLVALGRKWGLPVMEDLGSGSLADLSEFNLPPEPTVSEVLDAGVDLVTFSGDKLLGGPQAGLILGRADLVEKMRRSPIHRALRVGKLTLAALQATLTAYLDPAETFASIPALRMITAPPGEVRARARRLCRALRRILPSGFEAEVRPGVSHVGGGALPLAELPTHVVALAPGRTSVDNLAKRLRTSRPSVIARIEADRLLFDLRTVADDEVGLIVEAMRICLGG
ncbi:L-seryl-tRNA(Sec) selenium transferase [Thermodesulfobacteriota bacterium]